MTIITLDVAASNYDKQKLSPSNKIQNWTTESQQEVTPKTKYKYPSRGARRATLWNCIGEEQEVTLGLSLLFTTYVHTPLQPVVLGSRWVRHGCVGLNVPTLGVLPWLKLYLSCILIPTRSLSAVSSLVSVPLSTREINVVSTILFLANWINSSLGLNRCQCQMLCPHSPRASMIYFAALSSCINFAIPLTILTRPLLLFLHKQCRACLEELTALLFMVEFSTQPRIRHITVQGSLVS